METGTGGCAAREVGLAFAEGALFFPWDEVTVLPLGFDLDGEEGVLRGIRLPFLYQPLNLQETERHDQISCSVDNTVIESIAQMVCFSFQCAPGTG
jgi:hypothetical protein